MAYQYDLFVSYSGKNDWPRWVQQVLCPMLEHWVGSELGRDATVYVDRAIQTGCHWPLQLAQDLARSRVLVPLFSRRYVTSQWCSAELDHMLERERSCGMRSPAQPQGLIVPAIVQDGEHLPPKLRLIQSDVVLNEFTAVLSRDTGRGHELYDRVRCWAPSLAAAVDRAPPYQEDWETKLKAKFTELEPFPAPGEQ